MAKDGDDTFIKVPSKKLTKIYTYISPKLTQKLTRVLRIKKKKIIKLSKK